MLPEAAGPHPTEIEPSRVLGMEVEQYARTHAVVHTRYEVVMRDAHREAGQDVALAIGCMVVFLGGNEAFGPSEFSFLIAIIGVLLSARALLSIADIPFGRAARATASLDAPAPLTLTRADERLLVTDGETVLHEVALPEDLIDATEITVAMHAQVQEINEEITDAFHHVAADELADRQHREIDDTERLAAVDRALGAA